MVLAQPIDWGALYSALYTWANGATGLTVRWADQDEPRPDFPYVLLDIISSEKEGGIEEIGRTTDLSRARDTKVTPIAQDDTTYTVTINGNAAVFLSDSDATVAEITAGLKLAIDALSEPVTVVDNGTDLDITGDPDPLSLNPTQNTIFTIVVTDDFDGQQISRANNDAGNEVEVRMSGSEGFTLNVQAFERNTRTDNPASDPDRNAFNILTLLRRSLGLPSVQEQLRGADIAVIEELPILDLSEEVEDTLLSSASMDIRMRTTAELIEYIGFIQDVTGTGTYSGAKVDPITQGIVVNS